MEQDYYKIIVSPENIKSDLSVVYNDGTPVGVYSAMTQVVSSGPNGSSIMTQLSVPILLRQTAVDAGYYVSVLNGIEGSFKAGNPACLSLTDYAYVAQSLRRPFPCRHRGPRPRHGRRGRLPLRSPRPAARRRRDRRGALRKLPPPRPRRPFLDQPRPLRALGRPRLDVRLRLDPPRRLRPAAPGSEELPQAALQDPGSPRVRRDRRRRSHHRPARSGHRQHRRHGRRRQDGRRPFQHRRT